jgi:superfamily I DNA/RNA helicase
MTNRLNTLLGSKVAGQIIIKTFHSFGAMILREEGERIDIISNFTILNEQDRHTFLKQIYPDLGGKLINQYLEEISTAKSRLLAHDSILLQEKYQNDPGFIEIYKNYELALRKNQVVDFDDLIVLPVNLLETFPEILEQYQHRFRWISVDEYQDINLSQYRLLRLLATPETNLCIIGDPDQAIYGFRGANREYFLKFQDDFPEARTIQLSKNYRSTQLILEASGQIIAKSSERKTGEIWSDVVSNAKIDIYQAPTHNAEAEYVVHQIEKMVGGTSYFSLDSGRVGSEEAASHSFSDFAVLYRLGAQCQFLVEAFQRSGIPYQTVSQSVFYEHKEIQEILSYLWIIYNPDSIFHLEKIKKRSDKIVPFLNELRASLLTQPVAKLIKRIHEFSLNNQSQSQNQKSAELIKQLVLKSSPFENKLMDFLESTSLQKETDGYDPRAERVTLLTLHASKGLEFPVLFIVGCEENLIPYQRKGKPFDLEEERRLLYVGMTRAQERLILTHTKTRFLFGQRCENEPSRFLSDIENALIEFKKMTPRKPVNKRKDDQQLQLF